MTLMDNLPAQQEVVEPDETAAERERRLAWEAEAIAEALASYEAGFYVDGDEMSAWLKSVGTDAELPLPPVRKR